MSDEQNKDRTADDAPVKEADMKIEHYDYEEGGELCASAWSMTLAVADMIYHDGNKRLPEESFLPSTSALQIMLYVIVAHMKNVDRIATADLLDEMGRLLIDDAMPSPAAREHLTPISARLADAEMELRARLTSEGRV